MASVVLKNIHKSFGKTEIIPDLSLRCESNALTVFVGPSGCGKSTLLRMVAGLETPTSGDVLIDNERVNDAPPFARGVAMVFQSYALYPHMTVYENMKFGLSSLKLPKEEIDKRIKHAATILALDPYLKRKPKELSGGQRQRVAMGRAIVRQPKVYLFDEPLSNLDAALRVKMRLEIARLRQEFNATMIYVTHDQVEAMTLAHKIVVLRAGHIEQEGPPLEVYQRPANKFVASFLGSPAMNFIPASTSGLPNAEAIRAQSGVELGIRPEHLSLSADLPYRIDGRVYAVEQLGDQVLAHVMISGKTPDGNRPLLVARLPGDTPLGPQAKVTLGFEPRHCHVFDAEGRALQ